MVEIDFGKLIVIGVDFEKSIVAYLKNPKIARNSQVVCFVQKVFFEIESRFCAIGVVFGKLILRDLKSLKIAGNFDGIRFEIFKLYVLEVLADRAVSTST